MDHDARARAASAASLPPLGLLAATFFLPFLRSCDTMKSPLEYCDKAAAAVWIVPPFAAAALLAVVTGAALLRRRAPARGSFAAAWAALGGCLVTAVMYAWALSEPGRPWLTWDRLVTLVWSVAPVAVAVPILVFARRCDGWQRWTRTLAAFGALAAGHAVWVVGECVSGHPARNVGVGGWLYLAADLAILAAAAAGVRRRRAATA